MGLLLFMEGMDLVSGAEVEMLEEPFGNLVGCRGGWRFLAVSSSAGR